MDPEVPSELSEDLNGCPVNLLRIDMRLADNVLEWTEQVRELFRLQVTFGDLGRYLMGLISTMPTPLGNFMRSYCLEAAQPLTSSGEASQERHGDLLPIPVWRITTRIDGVTDSNVDWVKVVVTTINFHYCTGWCKPICVPIMDRLSPCQEYAITRMANVITANIITAHPLASLGECDKLLSSKKFDYAGRPVEYMEDLICERVLPAWPKKGQAAIQPIEAFLSAETKKALEDPSKLLLPIEKMPYNAPRSRVRATDQEWYALVKAAWERGMMLPVDDSCVPRDRQGHLITNGAGAVHKEKLVDGKPVPCQRFISILCPINAVTVPLAGAQDSLPYIGQLTGLLLESDESLYLESEDLLSAFNLFTIPQQWLGYFSYSKKVDGSALGLRPGVQVRPALSVIPMGWHSAVGLVQEAIRDIVFNRAGIPKHISAEKGKALPAGKSFAVVYLDNYDEIEVIKAVDVDLTKEGVEPTAYHQKFNEACDSAGLPRNLGKQLIHAYAGCMQGGEFCGKRGAKQRFMATFKRSLFAGMGHIFDAIERSRQEGTAPTATVVDEIMVLRQWSGLKVCGGGVGCYPDPIPYQGTCAECGKDIDSSVFEGYECPNDCGCRFCSIDCFASHRHGCGRGMMGKACFGERFSGPNCPLSKAVAMEKIYIQPPLDRLRDSWDFFSTSGRDCLEGMEDDGHLSASHWAPECKTFTTARGRPIWTTSGRYIQGPPALRSHERPWGLARLSADNQVLVRQGNGMAKRVLDTPVCPGHADLLPYECHDEGGVLRFDTAEESEYPWQLCRLYAQALKAQLRLLNPSPSAGLITQEMSIMSALRSSTRGFQFPEQASLAAAKVLEVMETMVPGKEKDHLRLMLRQVCLRGTDIKLLTTDESGSQSVMSPYPAFKWDWRVKLAFAWKQRQHPGGRKLPRSYARLDQLVADYINHLFQEQETLTKAGWLLSGLKRLYPRVRRELAISQQWYNNWCREHTPRRATPLTWQLLQAFVGVCIHLRWYRLATILLTSFVFFLRTSEGLHLRPGDFLCSPSDGSLVLRIAASKTSPTAQQSLAHFDPRLVSLLQTLLQGLNPEEPLWQFSFSHFRVCFTQLCHFFELQSLELVPYSIRRGGATYFYTKTDSLDAVMIRGRWKDATTARIYLDDARACLVRLCIPGHAKPLIRQFRRPFLSFSLRSARGQVRLG
eukprot:s280_g17.t1